MMIQSKVIAQLCQSASSHITSENPSVVSWLSLQLWSYAFGNSLAMSHTDIAWFTFALYVKYMFLCSVSLVELINELHVADK